MMQPGATKGATPKAAKRTTKGASPAPDGFSASAGFLLPDLRARARRAPAHPVARHGYLLKRSRKNTSVWKRRFFALRHGELCWWKALLTMRSKTRR